MPDSTDLNQLNTLPDDLVRPMLLGVCSSEAWADDLVAHRPYADLTAVCVRSDEAVAALDDTEIDVALAGHPRIGDRPTGAWSAREQASMSDAAADVAARIADGNRAYEARFGHVYLVCARGRSPEELLAILEDRLDNDPFVERGIVRQELAAINRIRLANLVTSAET